jgi:phosphomevalonate kinase
MVAVWSGRSAKTGPRVARYQAWQGRSGFVERSRQLVEAFPADPIACLRDAYALLQDMAVGAGLDYDSPEHQRIAALAVALGGAAKPSGAGGGDVAVALLPDAERLQEFVVQLTEMGLPPIPVQVVGP